MQKIDHRKVYGAGYHAGIKDSNNTLRGPSRGYRNASNTILCWNPGSSDVALIPWPDKFHRSDKYKMSALAAYTHVKDMNFEQRKAIVFITAMHLIVRDECDPASVHYALLGLEEYRDGCSADMPWMNDWI